MSMNLLPRRYETSRCPALVVPAQILLSVMFSVMLLFPMVANAEILHGRVNKDDELLRLNRPGPPSADSLRIDRDIPVAPQRLKGNLVDTGAFSNPLKGNAQRQDGKLGLVQPGQFGEVAPNKFDLGADRGSKELVLAWERWHHQLSQAIYSRWSDYCRAPGSATLRITVTRDRNIQVQMVHASGNPVFDQGLLDAIMSLNGNAGLTFPSQSQRRQVSLESDYIAGRNVNPGFSWVKDDYERVRESY